MSTVSVSTMRCLSLRWRIVLPKVPVSGRLVGVELAAHSASAELGSSGAVRAL